MNGCTPENSGSDTNPVQSDRRIRKVEELNLIDEHFLIINYRGVSPLPPSVAKWWKH